MDKFEPDMPPTRALQRRHAELVDDLQILHVRFPGVHRAGMVNTGGDTTPQKYRGFHQKTKNTRICFRQGKNTP